MKLNMYIMELKDYIIGTHQRHFGSIEQNRNSIMAKSYIVKGSEDGPIGVFTSHAKALECACMYVNQSINTLQAEGWEIDKSQYYTCISHPDTSVDANIEVFHTNYNPLT